MAVPVVIAHRGASGYLPEHSIEAKLLAYGQGADFLEQDVIATRDGELVVLHDLHLDLVSDVRERFPGRARRDGRHYVIDFDLAELESLRFGERRSETTGERLYPHRFGATGVSFRIVTLRTELALLAELNRMTRRDVGVYPEIKDPKWHREHGIDLAAELLATLAEFGYCDPEHRAFVQCFEADELERVRKILGSRLKLVQLIEDHASEPLSAAGLGRIAQYADAIGPDYRSLMEIVDGVPRALDVPRRIAAAGLELHPYTFRRDALPARLKVDFQALLAFFYKEIRVSGLFTDFPDLAVRARREVFGRA